MCKQELLSKAHTSDNGVEATKVQSLICIEEQCLFEAGRISMKATEDWRYLCCPSHHRILVSCCNCLNVHALYFLRIGAPNCGKLLLHMCLAIIRLGIENADDSRRQQGHTLSLCQLMQVDLQSKAHR